MIRQRTHRPNLVTAHHLLNASVDDERGYELQGKIRTHMVGKRVFLRWFVCFSFHIASVLVLATGVYWTFRKLYTAEECDMTWSQRQFLLIDFPTFEWHGRSVPKYRLFKFMDQRDPRHQGFHQSKTITTNDTSWCLRSTTSSTFGMSGIVLFIPGHGGSYEQSRSLGAHGTQLTEQYSGNEYERQIMRKLQLLKVESKATNTNTTQSVPIPLDDFFYDVYAIDWGEEGGGFHGARIERQAAFIATTVRRLVKTCGYGTVQVVAHSIGGISARLALATDDTMAKAVRTLITLGTPHQRAVLSWEPGMQNVYRQMHASSRSSDVVILSVSGGLRDEMIPPQTCRMNQNERHITLLSIDVMKPGHMEAKAVPPELGMDHRAIVWCHNLLSEIRHILYLRFREEAQTANGARQPTSVMEFMHQKGLTETYDYVKRLQMMHNQLKIRYGAWSSLVMETSLLYNTELLVKLYACVGGWRYLNLMASFDQSMISFLWLPSIGTAVVVYTCDWLLSPPRGVSHLPAPVSLLIQTLVADSVFLVACGLLSFLLRGRRWRNPEGVKPGNATASLHASILSLLLGMVVWCVAYTWYGDVHAALWLRPQAVLTVGAWVGVLLGGCFLISKLPPVSVGASEWSERQVKFVAWIAILSPFIVIGDLVAIPDGLTTWTVPVAFIPVAVRLFWSVWWLVFIQNGLKQTRTWVKISVDVARVVTVAIGCFVLVTMDQLSPYSYFGPYVHPISSLVILANACDLVEMMSMSVQRWKS